MLCSWLGLTYDWVQKVMIEEYNRREGKGIRWKMETKWGYSAGYTIDNLDKKNLSQAETLFEQIFVLTRMALEKNESYCMDVESERLKCCQAISEAVYPFIKGKLK